MTSVSLGSISHGTMRECDLIPAFMDALRELDPEAADRIADRHGAAFIERCSDPDCSEEAQEAQGRLLEALLDALDACAPPGCYFGAHPGNGADYGFWEAEDFGF